MQEADGIRKLRAYAEAVLQSLAAEAPPEEPEVEQTFAQIRAAAEETLRRAASPVKIGVVGEFNAGKSLLLGGLIGYADALPVSEVPTTGNVTALRLRPRPGLQRVEVGPYRVEFLDRATALDCLRELLRVADERARDAGLGPDDRRTLGGLRDRAAAAPWADVEGFCRKAWGHGGDHPNPALRNLLRELTWFCRCFRSAAGTALLGAAEPTDRVFEVNAETAREGLALPRSKSSIATMKFDELPGEPGPLPPAINAAWLRQAFPLVRRVEIDVGVSQRVWDLSGTEGAGEWVLLDFPGLGAAESGVRDGFLCKRELREVQTILILLDGRRPGGEGGQVIFSMMSAERPAGQDLRDSILVVVNRFDQLPIQADGGELVLDRLVAWTDPAAAGADSLPPADPEPVRDAEVLRQLPVLSAMVVGARNLTRRDDRVVLTSSLWTLGDLHASLPGDVPVGSPDFVATLTSLLKSPPAIRQKWDRLSGLLRDADPLSPLARWLADVSRDGGVGRLQRLVADHVAQHGLRQLLAYVRAAAEDLRRAAARLPKKRPQRPGQSGPSAESIRQAVDGLYDVYTALKAEFEQAVPELTVTVDGQAVPMQQHVHDQVTRSVFEWPVWNELLNKVQKDGTIQPVQATRGPRRGGWDDEDDAHAAALPADSRALFEPFARTLRDSETFAADCVRQAVRDQLAALAKRTRPFIEPIAPLLADARMRQRVEAFDQREKAAGRRAGGRGQLNVLAWAADPRAKEVGERFLERYLAPRDKPIPAEACFPLPGADPGDTPLRFPWARGQESAGGNHQVLVLRLRDALADGMRRRVLQEVSQLNKQVLDGLVDTFTTWSERLLVLAGNAPLLATLAGEVVTEPGGAEWKTAAVPYPLGEADAEEAGRPQPAAVS
jgi:hypothetical protein